MKKQTQRKTRRNRKGKQTNNTKSIKPTKKTQVVNRTHMKYTREACSMYDPFCDHAMGARLPTRGSTRAQVATLRHFITVDQTVTNANGFVIDFNNAAAPVIARASGGASDITFAGAHTALTGNLSNFWLDIGSYRVVSAGARFVPTIAATAQKPISFIQRSSDSSGLVGDNFIYGEYVRDPHARMNASQEFTFISKSCDDRSNEFRQISTASPYDNSDLGNYRDAMIFMINPGAANIQIGLLEVVFHIEYLIRSDKGSYHLNQSSKVVSPSETALAIRNKATQTIPSVLVGPANYVVNYVERSIASVAKAALPWVANALFPGTGPLVGMIENAMEVD